MTDIKRDLQQVSFYASGAGCVDKPTGAKGPGQSQPQPRPLSFPRLIARLCTAILYCSPAHSLDIPLLSLTPQHFKNTAVVTEDAVAATTTVSTEAGYAATGGLRSMVLNDEFLRGVVLRKTGERRFEIVVSLIYKGTFRSYDTASYSTPTQFQSSAVIPVGKRADYCVGDACTFTETLSFPIDEPSLRELAAGATRTEPTPWHFTVTAQSGPAYAGEISTAEMAGLLQKMDEVAPASAPGGHDAAALEACGAGLQVRESDGAGDVTGLAVSAVMRGGVAQRAGLTVGDVILAANGRLTRTLADWHSAVADAARAQSPIDLRIERGPHIVAITMQCRKKSG